MDEEIQTPQTETPPAGEETSVPASSAAETTTSPETPPADAPAETPAAPVEETPSEHQPERPAERRIRQLVSEIKEKNKQIESLTQAPVQSPQAPTLSSMLEGRESIDPAELDKIGQQFAAQNGTAAATLEVQKLRFEMSQKEAVTNFNNDQLSVEKLYPQLNPDSPEYNPTIEKIIADKWKREAVKKNPYNPNIETIDPTVRLTDVAKDYMDVAMAMVEQTKANTQAVLNTQQEETALTPNGEVVNEEVPFEQLSAKEMEAKLKAKGYFKPKGY